MRKKRYQYHSFSHRKRLAVSTGFKDHKSCENRDINIIHSLTERGWLYRQDLKTINHAKIEISISFIHSLTERGWLYRHDFKTINHAKIEISISFIHLMQFCDQTINHAKIEISISFILSQKEVGCIDRI